MDKWLKALLVCLALVGGALTAAGLWLMVRAGLGWDDGEY